jgi:hypothetical protein
MIKAPEKVRRTLMATLASGEIDRFGEAAVMSFITAASPGQLPKRLAW